jgi:hypothetical protein
VDFTNASHQGGRTNIWIPGADTSQTSHLAAPRILHGGSLLFSFSELRSPSRSEPCVTFLFFCITDLTIGREVTRIRDLQLRCIENCGIDTWTSICTLVRGLYAVNKTLLLPAPAECQPQATQPCRPSNSFSYGLPRDCVAA